MRPPGLPAGRIEVNAAAFAVADVIRGQHTHDDLYWISPNAGVYGEAIAASELGAAQGDSEIMVERRRGRHGGLDGNEPISLLGLMRRG